MGYASAEAVNSVGFVREVSVEELEKFMADNQNKKDVEEPTIFMRSPFELNLLNERIIDLRRYRSICAQIIMHTYNSDLFENGIVWGLA